MYEWVSYSIFVFGLRKTTCDFPLLICFPRKQTRTFIDVINAVLSAVLLWKRNRENVQIGMLLELSGPVDQVSEIFSAIG